MINCIGYILFFCTRNKRYRSAQMLSFLNAMVTFRLMVTISEKPYMKELLLQDKLAFGCLDTWLIYKLSGCATIITEPSNASSTGLFDPFIMNWGYTLLSYISFPTTLLPVINQSADKPLAMVDESIFGIDMNVGAAAGDQQAAAFANGCWKCGDINISLGTGSFVSVNTGTSPHASLSGLYPLVGWVYRDVYSFLAEGCCHDTGSVLEWCASIGLYKDISETSGEADQAVESDVFFIPAFNGIQTPINDPLACCAFFGMKSSTSKAQLIRSVLQSISFRIFQIWNTVVDEVDFQISSTLSLLAKRFGEARRLSISQVWCNRSWCIPPKFRCCGGVSSNDYICQLISTLTNRPTERVKNGCFSSAKGVALMAGLSNGLWSFDDLADKIEIDRTFYPKSNERPYLLKKFEKWEDTLKRCLNFYT